MADCQLQHQSSKPTGERVKSLIEFAKMARKKKPCLILGTPLFTVDISNIKVALNELPEVVNILLTSTTFMTYINTSFLLIKFQLTRLKSFFKRKIKTLLHLAAFTRNPLYFYDMVRNIFFIERNELQKVLGVGVHSRHVSVHNSS